MARAPVTTMTEVAAAIARLEEQVVTLQRERKEDKAEMRDEVAELRKALTDGLKGLKTDLTAELSPIRDELKPLTRLRWQAGAVLIILGLLFSWLGHKLGDGVARLFGVN